MLRQIKYGLFLFFFCLAMSVSGVVSVYAALTGNAYNGYQITYTADVGLVLGDSETFQENLDTSLITNIIFGSKTDYASNISSATNVQDVSAYQNGSIKRYLVGTTIYVLSEYDEEMFMNENSTSLFSGFSSATNFVFNDINTGHTFMMNNMFEGCSSLINLDLSSFDTSNVVKMDEMFLNCSSLETLNIQNFDTTNNVSATSFIDGATNIDTIITPSVVGDSFVADIDNANAKFYIVEGTTTQSQTAVTQIDSTNCATSKTLHRGYTVTFDSNGGESVATRVYTYGEAFPSSLTRSGYVFDGWYSSEESNNGTGTKYTSCQDLGNNVSALTVYAKWTAQQYTVTTSLSEGANCSVSATGSYETDLAINWAGNDFYDFVDVVIYGRPTADSEIGEVVLQTITSGTSTTYNMTGTYYPEIRIAVNYELNVTLYNITYDLQGGENGTTSAKGAYEQLVPNIVFPERFGYQFTGYTNSTTKITPTAEWNTLNRQLRVNYTTGNLSSGNQFTISLLLNERPTGATFNSVSLTEDEFRVIEYSPNYIVIVDMTVTDDHVSGLSALTRRLAFTGLSSNVEYLMWASVKNGHYYYTQQGPVRNLDVEEDITLYAQWEPNIYFVNYQANGGSGTMANSTHYYGTNSNLTANSFTKTGYSFAHWSENADGTGTTYSNRQSVLNLCYEYGAVKTLYAQWTPNTYTVTLNNQSATTAGTTAYYYKYEQSSPSYYYSNSNCTTQLGANGYTITCPTRTGYTFAGYYTGTNGSGTQYVNSEGTCINNIYSSVAGNTTLYAKWNPHHYTVQYNGNGEDSGSTPNSSHTYDVSSNVSANGFVKADKVLKEWNTSPDGTGTSIAPNGTALNLTSIDGATVTLYAIWKDKEYTISFNSNGGGPIPSFSSSTSGNNMSASFDSTNHRFTLTNTGTSDPFATIGNTISFEANKTYVMNMCFSDTNGGAITSGSIQIFYAINGSYTEAQSVHLSSSNPSASFTPTTTGNYNIRIDNDTGVNVLLYLWISDSVSDNEIYTAYNHAYGTLPTAPFRPGYTFNGWFTAQTGGTQITSSTIHPARQDITYYAQWSPNNYTVNFNANGGSVSTTSKQVVFDSQFGSLPTPTRANDAAGENYSFLGWFTDAKKGIQITDTDKFSVVGGTTLYAHWSGYYEFTVTLSGSVYDKNGARSSYEIIDNSDSSVHSTTSLTVHYGTVIKVKIGARGQSIYGTYVNTSISSTAGVAQISNLSQADSTTKTAWMIGEAEGKNNAWKTQGNGTRLVSKVSQDWIYGYIYIVVKDNVTITNDAGRA